MTERDARFEDANDEPLRLRVRDAEDLKVVSALLQDAVFLAADMSWDRGRREFSMLLNRFRWELRADERPGERVRSVLQVHDAMKVVAGDLRGKDAPSVFSLLSIAFNPGLDGTGTLVLVLSGDRDITVDVECLDTRLADVTRPHGSVARNRPRHG